MHACMLDTIHAYPTQYAVRDETYSPKGLMNY